MEAQFFCNMTKFQIGVGGINIQGWSGLEGVGCATVHLLGRLLSFGLLPCEAGNPARRVVSLLHFPV